MDASRAAPRVTPSRASRTQVRVAGGLAAVVSLAGLWALSALSIGVAFPPAALAELIIRSVPGDVATFSIELLQHWAMRLLTAGVMVASLLVGAEALVSTGRGDQPRPYVAGAALALLAGLLTLTGPTGGVSVPATAVALVLGALLYGFTAARLHALVIADNAGPDAARRRALRLGIGSAVAIAAGGGALGWIARRLSGPNTDVSIGTPAVHARIPERDAFPDVEGLSPEVTSVRDHYVVDIDLVQPAVEAAGWTMSVGGLVDRPLRLSFTELQHRFEFIEEFAVLTCVSNEVGGDLIGHSLWGGVRLADVLDAAGVRAGATDLKLAAADGYTDSIPVAVARDPAVLLAVAQNRRPLSQAHGFPCRLRVPPIYGMKNVKWIRSIAVVADNYKGYWAQRGWSDVATVRTQSRIDVAGNGDGSAAAGRATWIAGVAWAGDRGIERVEVSTDGAETWHEATLRDPIGPLSWRQWAYRWTPEGSGRVSITCRATDGRGATQTAATAAPHPAGATGYHTVAVDVS
jgi:DMSO/TMAO reductase YedYZ molybdopterin-dependent catalytic subunit